MRRGKVKGSQAQCGPYKTSLVASLVAGRVGVPIGIYTTFHGPPSDNDLSVFPLSSALTFDCLNATINWS